MDNNYNKNQQRQNNSMGEAGYNKGQEVSNTDRSSGQKGGQSKSKNKPNEDRKRGKTTN